MNSILVILLAMLFSHSFQGWRSPLSHPTSFVLSLTGKQGIFGSQIIKIFTNNPGKYIATMLIGNNVALVIYGLFFSRLLNPILIPVFGSDILVLIFNTVISTGILLRFFRSSCQKQFLSFHLISF